MIHCMCVYYMMGTPEGSTESGFMEKAGIEPATPVSNNMMSFVAYKVSL